VHINAYVIVLGAILAHPSEGNLDHLVYFANINLSQAEHKYTTIKREGSEMVYDLKMFRPYLLGSQFKLFIDHSDLKYLLNKLVLEGRFSFGYCCFIIFF